MATTCKCGADVGRVEVRVVQRCTLGHYITSGAAPAILTAAAAGPQSPGQQRAFHAKTNAIDKLTNQKIGTTKRRALDDAGHVSSTELDSVQMTAMLDALEVELADLQTDE